MKVQQVLDILKIVGKYTAKTLGVIGKIIGSVLLVFVFTGVICVGAFGFYVKEYMLPQAELDVGNINMNYSSIIYATDAETGEKTELTRLYGSENRIWVNYDQIPQDMVDAFIAIEDERFESHKGVDWRRTLGAVINVIKPFSSNFGGSTITQQLVKNLTEDTEVTIQRKVLEILRALNLERQLTKDQIMEMYLNTINLSQGCYGVSSAAYVYFGKEVSELSLAECAVIAGITNSPTYYDPFQNPDNNKARQELILEKMLELGRITEAEYEAAVAEELVFRDYSEETTDTSNVRSYFEDLLVTELVAELQEVYGYSATIAYKLLYAGGLSIEATIDPKVQNAMEQVYENRDNFPTVKGTTQLESAMVIFSPDGKLLGVVGGIGQKYGNLVLNRAVSRRAPGSAIKPLSVFAPAIEYGLITPYSVLDDSPSKIISMNGALVEAESAILIGNYGLSPWPANQNRTYGGRTTVNSALARSLNTVAVRTIDLMSLETAFDFATENFGLSLMRQETINGVTYNDL
ncbi:MAG: transglycosylase domain-containing protein, partial [Clostridia bacterium]|nr:transglycosylase domain-containing protein [Clostridia bacterium]